jgi:hypothetical protein
MSDEKAVQKILTLNVEGSSYKSRRFKLFRVGQQNRANYVDKEFLYLCMRVFATDWNTDTGMKYLHFWSGKPSFEFRKRVQAQKLILLQQQTSCFV